jgi:hypothetical protein
MVKEMYVTLKCAAVLSAQQYIMVVFNVLAGPHFPPVLRL